MVMAKRRDTPMDVENRCVLKSCRFIDFLCDGFSFFTDLPHKIRVMLPEEIKIQEDKASIIL